MIRRILWKELLNNLRSLRLSLTFILLMLSVMIAGLVFAQKYHQMIEDHSRNVNVDLQRMRDRAKSTNDLAFHEHRLYKSPNPMRLCAEGREKYTPNSFLITICQIDGMENRTRLNFLRARLEDLDWAFIIGVIVSFAAIILTYDAISGEREDGTLKLMMSNSVSRASIILGKYLGGIVSLLIPLVAAIILNLIIVLILGVNFTPEQWGRIGMISLISLVYTSCFLMLGLFVSSLTRSSTVSLVILQLAINVSDTIDQSGSSSSPVERRDIRATPTPPGPTPARPRPRRRPSSRRCAGLSARSSRSPRPTRPSRWGGSEPTSLPAAARPPIWPPRGSRSTHWRCSATSTRG